jgi:hypothetical protein
LILTFQGILFALGMIPVDLRSYFPGSMESEKNMLFDFLEKIGIE